MQDIQGLGNIIHGIHSVTGIADCMNCHTATEDGEGLVLWDDVKHDVLHGITDIDADDMDGDFSWRQDEVLGNDTLFDIHWFQGWSDYTRQHLTEQEVPEDDETFQNWTITLTGEVGQETTWTLGWLVENAPSVTQVMKIDCVDNMYNGPFATNVEVTGIPLSWLVEQAGGYTADAKSIRMADPAGYLGAIGPVSLESLEDNSALVVYEIGGERLSWANGFPVVMMWGGEAACANCKQLCDIMVSPEETEEYLGWTDEEGNWAYNKPGIGFLNAAEGQIVKTGETFQLHGYADAYDEPITAVELSMDRGQTWTRFDIEGANTDQLVTWTYDFTPENDGAYVFMARSIMEDGTVTDNPISVMVVAKAEIPEE